MVLVQNNSETELNSWNDHNNVEGRVLDKKEFETQRTFLDRDWDIFDDSENGTYLSIWNGDTLSGFGEPQRELLSKRESEDVGNRSSIQNRPVIQAMYPLLYDS